MLLKKVVQTLATLVRQTRDSRSYYPIGLIRVRDTLSLMSESSAGSHNILMGRSFETNAGTVVVVLHHPRVGHASGSVLARSSCRSAAPRQLRLAFATAVERLTQAWIRCSLARSYSKDGAVERTRRSEARRVGAQIGMRFIMLCVGGCGVQCTKVGELVHMYVPVSYIPRPSFFESKLNNQRLSKHI